VPQQQVRHFPTTLLGIKTTKQCASTVSFAALADLYFERQKSAVCRKSNISGRVIIQPPAKPTLSAQTSPFDKGGLSLS